MIKMASIDIGTYTARILIAEAAEALTTVHPLKRNRSYIRLGDGYNREGWLGLDSAAMGRTLKTIENFGSLIEKYKVDYISAVATGVIRQAPNRNTLLDSIYERTGIRVRVISGEEEARLVDLGVSSSLQTSEKQRIIFDLGGGSTEFIFSRKNRREFMSIPLGAMTLSQTWLTVDPPTDSMVHDLSEIIDTIIEQGLSHKTMKGEKLLIGTGGTVTTLAAIANQVEIQAISPNRLHRTRLSRERISSIFQKLKRMNRDQRSRVVGLDEHRADVILAGTLTILGILNYVNARELLVSLCDLLEGLIIDHLKENENE